MFTFKRRWLYVAVAAALALCAPPATPLAMIETEDGKRWVGFSPEEFEQARTIFLAQRQRIDALEQQVRDLKASGGCS